MISKLILLAAAMGSALAAPTTADAPYGIEHKDAKATYFFPDKQPGSCGIQYHTADMIVALPGAMYDQYNIDLNSEHNPLCGKTMRVWHGAKTIDVKVGDRCPPNECTDGHIDLSGGAFDKLSPRDPGHIRVTWMLL